jgi:ABC-type transporter Mla MlaB component
MADPTVADVFDQLVLANGKLDQLNLSFISEANALTKLNGEVNKASKAAVDLLTVIAKIDTEAVKLLFHLTQQAEAMICALEHVSKNTCGILTQATIQTQVETSIRTDADTLRAVAESAYPQAVLERHRLAALRAEIERCCPPAQPQAACSYEPCQRPDAVDMPHLPQIPEVP